MDAETGVELITVQAAANRLAVSRWMIYRLIWEQQLNQFRSGAAAESSTIPRRLPRRPHRRSRMMAARGKVSATRMGKAASIVEPMAVGRQVFVDTPDGRRKRISVYGDTEREALWTNWEKFRDQQRRGIPVATTTLTVAEYMTYWLEHIAEPSIRRTTYATYEGDVRLAHRSGYRQRKLKSLQASHIRTWLTKLRTTCQCCAQGRTPRGKALVLRDGESAVLPGRPLVQFDPPYSQGACGPHCRTPSTKSYSAETSHD